MSKRPTFLDLITAYGESAAAQARGDAVSDEDVCVALDALTRALRKAGIPLGAVAP